MKRLSLIVTLLLLLFTLGCTRTPESGQRVLLIFSYHAEYPWVTEETRGVEDILKEKRVEIEKFYLDTKRNTSAEWKEKVTEEAVNKIDNFKPDLVIVFDDNACDLVAKRYIGKTLPIVFCGMNGEPEDYGFPAQNITGIIERLQLEETIGLLKRLVPDARKVAMITDNSPSSQAIVARARRTALPIEIDEFYSTDDFDAWKAKVIELQSRVDAIGLVLYHTLKEKGEEASLPAEYVLEWTLDNSELPEFALFDFAVRGGALCGVTLSGYEQGKAAAEIAVKILDGKKTVDIPIQSSEEGKPIVNEGRAKELNMMIPKDMPNEAEIVH